MVGKQGALSGEQASDTGPDGQLRGVGPYSMSLDDIRSWFAEPSCDMAWQANVNSERVKC